MNAWQWIKMLFTRRLVVRKGTAIDVEQLAKGAQLYVPHSGYSAWEMMESLRILASVTCFGEYLVSVIEVSPPRVSALKDPYVVPPGWPFYFTYEVTLHDPAGHPVVRAQLPHDHTTSAGAFMMQAQQKLLAATLTMREGREPPFPG